MLGGTPHMVIANRRHPPVPTCHNLDRPARWRWPAFDTLERKAERHGDVGRVGADGCLLEPGRRAALRKWRTAASGRDPARPMVAAGNHRFPNSRTSASRRPSRAAGSARQIGHRRSRFTFRNVAKALFASYFEGRRAAGSWRAETGALGVSRRQEGGRHEWIKRRSCTSSLRPHI